MVYGLGFMTERRAKHVNLGSSAGRSLPRGGVTVLMI